MSAASGDTVATRAVPAHLACRVGSQAENRQRDQWLAVASIALGSFALVFSELIPVGLLVVVPAVAAALAAPALTLASARLERRSVLLVLSVLLLASDVVGGVAPDIALMLAARAVLGVCIGGFWVFGAAAAIALVGEKSRGTAMALVSSGIFVATVASLPAASPTTHRALPAH